MRTKTAMKSFIETHENTIFDGRDARSVAEFPGRTRVGMTGSPSQHRSANA